MAKVVIIHDDGRQELVREVTDGYCTGDIFFADDYFAIKRWCRDDIAATIKDLYDREATEEEIDDVINAGEDWPVLNDCTDEEWWCINEIVKEVLKEPEKKEEPEEELEEWPYAYFEYYGYLQWLDPEQYYAEPWTYVGYAEDEDGKLFDLVRNNKTMEMRFTNI